MGLGLRFSVRTQLLSHIRIVRRVSWWFPLMALLIKLHPGTSQGGLQKVVGAARLFLASGSSSVTRLPSLHFSFSLPALVTHLADGCRPPEGESSFPWVGAGGP